MISLLAISLTAYSSKPLNDLYSEVVNRRIYNTATISRIAFAALGSLAVYKLGIPFAAAVAGGACLSQPAVAIGGGTWLVYNGVTALVDAISFAHFTGISSASFAFLATGFAFLAGGHSILDNYRRVGVNHRFQLLEQFI